MRSVRFLFLLIAGLLVSSASAFAQQTEMHGTADLSVVIENRADHTLLFVVRPQDGNWSDYQLDSGQSATILCNQCQASSFEIQINTNGQVIDTQLATGSRYYIDWNDLKNAWDVFPAPE